MLVRSHPEQLAKIVPYVTEPPADKGAMSEEKDET